MPTPVPDCENAGSDSDNGDTGNNTEEQQNNSATATGTDQVPVSRSVTVTQNDELDVDMRENETNHDQTGSVNQRGSEATAEPTKNNENSDLLKNFMFKMQQEFVTFLDIPADQLDKERMEVHRECFENMMNYFDNRMPPQPRLHSVSIKMEDDGTLK